MLRRDRGSCVACELREVEWNEAPQTLHYCVIRLTPFQLREELVYVAVNLCARRLDHEQTEFVRLVVIKPSRMCVHRVLEVESLLASALDEQLNTLFVQLVLARQHFFDTCTKKR